MHRGKVSARESLEIVNRLLDNGARINRQGRRYGSVLGAASAEGNIENANLLLEKGADCNAPGESLAARCWRLCSWLLKSCAAAAR